MELDRTRQFAEALVAHDLDAAEKLLDPDVETVTPRSTVRGIAACPQVPQQAAGDEQFALEQAEPELEELEGDVIAGRMRSLAGVKPAKLRTSVTSRCA